MFKNKYEPTLCQSIFTHLLPKPSSVVKVFGTGSIFCGFSHHSSIVKTLIAYTFNRSDSNTQVDEEEEEEEENEIEDENSTDREGE